MLTAVNGVKNQMRVTRLSIRYAVMREMLNKFTFLSNILFMILNNACMIIQWIVLYSINDNIGGYTFKQMLLLWGLSASIYGFAHFFFEKAFHLTDTINTGKLDAFLVQPKNVLLQAISSDTKISSLGDLLFGFIMYFIHGFTIESFLLFIFFTASGGLILTAISIILNSLSFWLNKSDMIAEVGNSLMINFSTYPDGIFKGITRILLFTLIPVGIANYIPIHVMTDFNIYLFFINIGVTLLFMLFAFLIFYQGLKKYSSSNLMSARI